MVASNEEPPESTRTPSLFATSLVEYGLAMVNGSAAGRQRFPIRLGRRSRLLLRVFGVRGVENAYVDLDSETFDARFGWSHVRVPLANIVSWRIEGPWLWVTAIGVRLSVHRDLTFGGSPRGGVRVDFRRPVAFGLVKIPALYVTVEDLEGLAAALAASGIEGSDARAGSGAGRSS
jgi:hypothetical protein